MRIWDELGDELHQRNMLVPLTLGVLALARPLERALRACDHDALETPPGLARSAATDVLCYGLLGWLALAARLEREVVASVPEPPPSARPRSWLPPGVAR